ncbi:hypothetical protein JCM3770_007437 [Rhodotorula araucariae]
MAVDHLARLPVELFLDICEEVHVCCPRQYLGRDSKAFLPVAREHAFTNLRIVSYKSLARLVQAVNASPGAGAYIKTLHIRDASHLPRDRPFAPEFATFLGHLPHLKEFRVDAVLFMERLHRAIPKLPALRTMLLDHPFDGPDTASLVKLVKMALADLPDLLASTPPLHSLRLAVSRGIPSGLLSTLLQSVAHPSALCSLTLCQHRYPCEDLSAVLPLFPSLCMLEFGGGASTATLVPALSVLPALFHLSSIYNSPLVDADLLALIDATASAMQREPTVDVFAVFPSVASRCDDAGDDPGWTDQFTLAGMVDVVEAADKAGVNIHGLAVARARQEQERRRRAFGTSSAIGPTQRGQDESEQALRHRNTSLASSTLQDTFSLTLVHVLI